MRAFALLLLIIGGSLLVVWLVLPLLPASPLTPTRISALAQNTGAPTPTSAPAPPLVSTAVRTPATAAVVQLYPSRQRIAVAYPGEPRPSFPPPAPPGQAFVANGDVDNSQTCHIKVFPAGVPVQGLGAGAYELWVITGTPADQERLVSEIQALTMGAANGPCPRVP